MNQTIVPFSFGLTQNGVSRDATVAAVYGARLPYLPAVATPLTDQLSHRRFDLKLMVGQLAMQLSPKWKSSLFRQLDCMLEEEGWHEDDQIPGDASLRTFLKALLYIRPSRLPSLALSGTGNFIGAWLSGRDRLTIEFMPLDKIRWVLVCYDNDLCRSAAASDQVGTLLKSLSGFNPERWFKDGQGQVSAGS